jgi:uncharacterized protein
MSERKQYVLYHAPCFDGFTAAWTAHTAGLEAEYIPIKYGDPFPDVEKGSFVHLLDVSFPRKIFERITKEKNAELFIIDHHKTAAEDLAGWPLATFDMDHSGAYLAWKYFHGSEASVPAIVQYVEDRDLWRWKLPHSREISAWLALFPLTFSAWDEASTILRQNFDLAVEHGTVALQCYGRMVEDILAQNVRCCEQIGGYSVPVANCPKLFGSDVAAALLELYPDAKFSAYYCDASSGVREYGLRSRGDFDVAEVAKIYGGGGHAAASGFRVGRNADLNPEHFLGGVVLE